MKKADVIIRSKNDNGRYGEGVPALNVKWYPWMPDIFSKFEGTIGQSEHLCAVCGVTKSLAGTRAHRGMYGHPFKPGGTYVVHEYGDTSDPEIAGFWQWVHTSWDNNTCEDEFRRAEEIAREVGWEDAEEFAKDLFGNHVKVWSQGRSGGWLVVEGLPDVETWDAIALGRWAQFAKGVQSILDDLDYQFVWHLYVNVYENLMGALA